MSSAVAAGIGPAVAAGGPAPAATAPVPPLLPLTHAPYPRPPGPSEMFSESIGRLENRNDHISLKSPNST